jgi:hypothetical protein
MLPMSMGPSAVTVSSPGHLYSAGTAGGRGDKNIRREFFDDPRVQAVRLLDVIVQPGKTFGPNKMDSPMVCHILEGEMEIIQDMGGGTFTEKKN